MNGINSITLVGTLGKDPETKYMGEKDVVSKFSIATNREFKDRSGTKHKETDWHNIEIWASGAKFVEQYVKKGAVVGVQGELRYNEYEKDGHKQIRAYIQANTVQLISSPSKGNGSSSNGSASASTPSTGNPAAELAKKEAQNYVKTPGKEAIVGANDDQDDLPF